MPQGDSGDPRGPRGSGPGGYDDYGQGDYSTDYVYDPRRRTGYRAQPDYVTDWTPQDTRDAPPRSWEDHPERFGGPISGGERPARRRGPSDRVLWAVICERLQDERRLDLRDVEVLVENGEVTLNGSVHHKGDKRRIEDVADIDGVHHVQNNLRVRHRGWF
jgi:hypothetical protein